MTRSQIFTAAHKLAKTFTGNYSACFALALREVYESVKNSNKMESKTISFSEFKAKNSELNSGFYFGDQKETDQYALDLFKEFLNKLVKVGKINSYSLDNNNNAICK